MTVLFLVLLQEIPKILGFPVYIWSYEILPGCVYLDFNSIPHKYLLMPTMAGARLH